MKLLSKICALSILIFVGVLFVGCGVNDRTDLQINQHAYYIDDSAISCDNFTIECSCSKGSTVSSSNKYDFTVKITNRLNTKYHGELKKVAIVRENTNYRYEVQDLGKTLDIEPYITQTYNCYSTIPTTIDNEHYYLTFVLSNETINYYLYERPDKLRADFTITLKLFNYPNYSIVDTLKVKAGRSYGSTYVHENPDHVHSCTKWYIDEDRKTEFNWNSKITDNITLYGLNSLNIKSSYDTSGYYITGINYVPSDGILVILNNTPKNTFISNYGICNNNDVIELYLPKIERIYFGNFTNMNRLTRIHYAGTQTEWEDIQTSSTVPNNIELLFNSTY